MPFISSGGGGGGGTTLGRSGLVYRYTVAGSAKASIDTGVDVAQAGSNDWTTCDLIEIFFYGRSDKAAVSDDTVITLNNDTAANYDEHWARVVQITSSNLAQVGNTSLDWAVPAASEAANVFGTAYARIINPTGTTGLKNVGVAFGVPSETAVSLQSAVVTEGYRSTSAITRFKIKPSGAGNFVVGTQLLIYKRFSL